MLSSDSTFKHRTADDKVHCSRSAINETVWAVVKWQENVPLFKGCLLLLMTTLFMTSRTADV